MLLTSLELDKLMAELAKHLHFRTIYHCTQGNEKTLKHWRQSLIFFFISFHRIGTYPPKTLLIAPTHIQIRANIIIKYDESTCSATSNHFSRICVTEQCLKCFLCQIGQFVYSNLCIVQMYAPTLYKLIMINICLLLCTCQENVYKRFFGVSKKQTSKSAEILHNMSPVVVVVLTISLQ